MVQETCEVVELEQDVPKPHPPVRALARTAWRRLWSVVYVPALLVPAAALLLVGLGWATGWGGADFASSSTSLGVQTIGPTASALIVVFLVAERVRPAQSRPLVARGHLHDLLFAVLYLGLVVPLVTALTLGFADAVRQVAPWVILPRLGVVPRWAVIVVILVAMDFFNWLVHLANHRVPMLWRFHELHHSQEDMNVLTVFRTHPLIHVSYLAAVVPALVLIENGELPTLLLVFYGGVVAFAHSNTNLGFGPLDRLFVSPNYHRIHHRVTSAQDVNLGFTLTIWDQLAHRAIFPTPETVGADTGLPQRPLRVEQQGTRAHHLSVFTTQILGPFRPIKEPITPPSVKAPDPNTSGLANDQPDAGRRR